MEFVTRKRIQVVIVDSDARVRRALHISLRDHTGVVVVGEAKDGPGALRLLKTRRPDIVVMNVSLPGMSGFEAAARIEKRFPGVRIVLLSENLDEASVQQALQAHPAGLLIKDASVRLPAAIREVAAGRKYVSPVVSRFLGLVGHAKRRTGKQIQLTPRQREVVRLIAEGFSTKQIADRLGISVKTAQTHRAQLMKRLDLHDVASVVRYAIAAGLATASN